MHIASSSTAHTADNVPTETPLVSLHCEPGKYFMFSAGRIWRYIEGTTVVISVPMTLGYGDGTVITHQYTISTYLRLTSASTIWIWDKSGNPSTAPDHTQGVVLYALYIEPA